MQKNKMEEGGTTTCGALYSRFVLRTGTKRPMPRAPAGGHVVGH
jgi:hypothetical protein